MQEVQPSDERGIPRVELPQTPGVFKPPGHDVESLTGWLEQRPKGIQPAHQHRAMEDHAVRTLPRGPYSRCSPEEYQAGRNRL